ncbi:MAG: hypothetical protein KDE31_38645, partial [Caldilineaceae bacterium]|nr:hypothetical protein [Caldilineaceae bacterium]
QRLFGDVYFMEGGESRSEESMVIIDDAFSAMLAVELRDGVAIDPTTRTAEDDKKFDIELLAAGTTFDLSLELLIREGDNRTEFLQALALGLTALAQGEIRLGKRKRRGFGQCAVDNWNVQRFNMKSPEGMVAWLCYDAFSEPSPSVENQSLFALLDVPQIDLLKPIFRLDATFRLDGSLLIRSAPEKSSSPDNVHLQSYRPENKGHASVLSGTSLGGALRARALRIVNTVKANGDGTQFVNNLFGYRSNEKNDSTPLWASRLWVDETVIQEPVRLVQSRVKIDRFTGGSFPGALFSEEAAFGGQQTKVKIQLTLGRATNRTNEKNPDGSNDDAEIGLLLMLLKDLWTGDLPIGGESSIGRGRLCGESVTIQIRDKVW